MQIIDITTFNNQIELLDLRINILKDVVDVFYIVESTKTHQGNPKEILGDGYSHPQLRVITLEFPEDLDNWGRENYQRAFQLDLSEFDSDSIVLTSDLDEIPDPEALKWLRDNINPEVVYHFDQQLFQYYLNVQNTTEPWSGTRACSLDIYNNTNAEILRWGRHDWITLDLPKAGWHWSFLGGEKMIEQKIRDYAHAEYNNDHFLSQIKERMDSNEDIFGRGNILQVVDIDESYPQYIRSNRDKLSHLIKDK